jgi:hypothetical protein
VIDELDAETFETKWKSIHDRVFSGREADEKPFASNDWPMALLARGLSLGAGDLRALRLAASMNGDAKAVICDGEGEWEDEPARILDLSEDDLGDLESNSVYGHTVSHLFGQSGEWGLVTSHESFAIFSANPKTFSAFVAELGGSAVVEARFEEAAGDIGFGDAGSAYVAGLRRMVGWARE